MRTFFFKSSCFISWNREFSLKHCNSTLFHLSLFVFWYHKFSILLSAKMWSAWIQKADQVVIEHIFEVMKIQYSQNHRDLEGEQAMKAKQSLKWHPESILDLINLSRINDILWSSSIFNFNKAMIFLTWTC